MCYKNPLQNKKKFIIILIKHLNTKFSLHFFREEIREKVTIESLRLKDHGPEAFGRSIMVTNSNLSNLGRNGTMHDMRILELVFMWLNKL